MNKEAESLDWTKSRGHTLSGTKFGNEYDEDDDFFDEQEQVSQRLGGYQSDNLGNARESSVAAAYRRLSHTGANDGAGASKLSEKPDPDDLVDVCVENKAQSDSSSKFEPDPDDTTGEEILSDNASPAEDDDEPDPDDSETHTSIREVENMETSNDSVMADGNLKSPPADETMQAVDEPDPDDQEIQRIQDPVTIISNRLKKAITALETKGEAATNVLQMLLKIVRYFISSWELISVYIIVM